MISSNGKSNSKIKILYQANVLLKNKDEFKAFLDKQNCRQFSMT